MRTESAGRLLTLDSSELSLRTSGRGFYEFNAELNEAIGRLETQNGICQLFIRHTSASLLITENADPAVLTDLERFISRLVPDGHADFTHRSEGPDDMPAHIRSVLTATSLTVPIHENRLALGTWQGIFLWEHRASPHLRTVEVTILGM